MKIYNKEKTERIENPNLLKGYLKEDILVTHIPYQKCDEPEYIKRKKEGTDEFEYVLKVGKPTIKAHDEEEKIQVYIPYTEEEQVIFDNNKKISKNKNFLEETDYIVTKIAERKMLGQDVSAELELYKDILAKREECRKIINEAEIAISKLNLSKSNIQEVQNGQRISR